MTLQIFGHPFSAYTWKALIALHENATPFAFRMLDPDHPENGAELARHWPIAKFPLLLDGDEAIFEATSVIEHLAAFHPGPVALIPVDPKAAGNARRLDRVFDNYVMNVVQEVVFDALRPEAQRNHHQVEEARARLDTIYTWLDSELVDRSWAIGDDFTLADCAAAPALFYADWTQPIGEDRRVLKAYQSRLLERPSVARCVDEARPYRGYFPLGAPDRD